MVSKSHRQKTSIKKRTLNPEFNSVILYKLRLQIIAKILEITIYCTV